MPLQPPLFRPVFSLPRDTTALEAARWMSSRDVSAVVVTDDTRPVGLVTDRDLVARVLALGLRPSGVRLHQICRQPLVTISADEPPATAARLMREHAARWLVAVEPNGRAVGLMTVGDLFAEFARSLTRLSVAVNRLRPTRSAEMQSTPAAREME